MFATENEWTQMVNRVCEAMRDEVSPYITPISAEVDEDWGELVGSGSHVSYRDEVFVVTNAHVLDELKGRRGGHRLPPLSGDEDSQNAVLRKPFGALTPPLDCAAVKVSKPAWQIGGKASSAIPYKRFAVRHNPIDSELLFFFGFAGERSKSFHRVLIAPGIPYTSQQPVGAPPADHPELEFHMLYPVELIKRIGDEQRDAPLPPGFSGSLVWNTRFVEVTRNNGTWSPSCAVVTGILKKWIEKEKLLTATKIERAGFQGLFDALL